MTHGEELGSELQEDSVVLTYLEGLLMHQAASGSGTAVDDGSSERPTEDQKSILSGNMLSSCHGNGSVLNSTVYQGSGLLHLKKARLLQSSDDWHAAKRRRLSDPAVQLNGKNEALLTGMVENVPKAKQDSTLLASLLQSFSSRLQTVALSQQIRQSISDQSFSHHPETLQKEKDTRCYGVASSHLKTLLKKNKAKDAKAEHLPDLSQNHNGGFIDSPKTGQSTTKGGVAEPLSCAARLQAVASMVEKRSSPATSPKPSVACSQLALLLSSEAHLQQYSQEHAMKAQTASQLASERLAAMARLQESAQQDLGHFQLSSRMSNINGQSRTPPNAIPSASNIPPFPSPTSILGSPPKTNYKHPSERNHSKPSLNNSLLLHLLKSQNVIQKNKIHPPNEMCTMRETSRTPTTIDEFSDNNPSFTEDDSSDDESSHSNCVPIDLSFKQRQDNTELARCPSFDNLTQSLLQNWDPKVQGFEHTKETESLSDSSPFKPLQKVTLLQLLLGHKSDEHMDTSPEIHRSQKAVNLAKINVQAGIPSADNIHIHRATPLNTPPLFNCTKADSPINLSHQSLTTKADSPPSSICNSQLERINNPASKHLMDLSKSKEPQTPKPLTSEPAKNSASFSASKLLQNLAQCGIQTSSSVEEPKMGKKQMNGSAEKTVGLINRRSSPLLQNRATVLEENKMFSNPSTLADPRFSGSEIENLLERRTVLQLLLGTPSKSEKKTKKRLNQDDLQSPSEKCVNGQILAVQVKTEPSEEVPTAGCNPHTQQVNTKNNNVVGVFRSPNPSPSLDTCKREPHSPQDFSFSRNGLLSRLLRQNHDDYPTDAMDTHPKMCDFTFMETKNHCTIPKKRKVPCIEPSECQTKRMKGNVSEGQSRHASPSDASYRPLPHQQEVNCDRLDSDLKYNAVHSSHNETGKQSLARESKGFNVLKQLLLSENCIRDMTQHRITTEGWMNGGQTSMAHKPDYSTSSLNALMGNHVSQTNCIDQRTPPYTSVASSPAHPLPEHFSNLGPRPEVGQFSTTTADKGPIRWVITGMEKREFGRDSPRLTKTNPILYYMLQKGGHAVGNPEAWGRNGWGESQLMDNATHMSFKGDADREANINFVNLQNSYNHLKNTTLHHNGSGDIFGLSEKVQRIKKEPE
ncbi:nuclear receptor-interacting protein 1 [Ambystoma mexicanum]|uniref:nuclear receptor-interacting protein 1 n=1 Tax=Ambystoma mexicanum TaxID=8296 RepID=UPI0037E97DD2